MIPADDYNNDGLDYTTDWQCVETLEYDINIDGYRQDDFDARYNWCLKYESEYRFYADMIFGQFYFENEGDRMMFMLRWV